MSDSLKTFIVNKFALRTLSTNRMKLIIDRKKAEISKLKKGDQRTSIFFAPYLSKLKGNISYNSDVQKNSFESTNNQDRERQIKDVNCQFHNNKLKELNNYLQGFSFSNRPLQNYSDSKKSNKTLNKEIKTKSFISDNEIKPNINSNESKWNVKVRNLVSNISKKHIYNIRKLQASFTLDSLNLFISQFLDDLSSIFGEFKEITKYYKQFLKVGYKIKKNKSIENQTHLVGIDNKIEIKQSQPITKELMVSPAKINFQLNKHLNLTSPNPLKVKYLSDKKILKTIEAPKVNNVTNDHIYKIGQTINIKDISFQILPLPTKLLKSSNINN